MKRFNTWLAGKITGAVGTMACAYLFAALTLPALPTVIEDVQHGHYLSGVQWITQTFIQLVLLPIIMVGQKLGVDGVHKHIRTNHAEHTEHLTTMHANVVRLHASVDRLHRKVGGDE